MNLHPIQPSEPHILGRRNWQTRIPPAENPFKRGLILALKTYAHLAFVVVSVTMGLQYWAGEPITLLGAQGFCLGQLGLIDEMAAPNDRYRGLRLITPALFMLLGAAAQAYQTLSPRL
jgi:hypothetical protein